jgi:KDO2-lipid IV(A) lauroyltransferase
MSKAARHELARESLKHTGILAFELGPVWCQPMSWLSSKLERVEDEGLLMEAQALGRGVLVMSPHIGNWEVIGRVLGRYGELTSLYQPPKQEYLEAIIHSARQQDGATLVPTNARGVAALLKALKRGCISGILPDQVPDKNSGKHAPFFGYPALTMTLIHGLVQRTQCAVVFGITLRSRRGWILKFIKVDDDIYSEQEDLALAALNRGVERCIEVAPEQYQWEYKRFKREPEGYPKLYG